MDYIDNYVEEKINTGWLLRCLFLFLASEKVNRWNTQQTAVCVCVCVCVFTCTPCSCLLPLEY